MEVASLSFWCIMKIAHLVHKSYWKTSFANFLLIFIFPPPESASLMHKFAAEICFGTVLMNALLAMIVARAFRAPLFFAPRATMFGRRARHGDGAIKSHLKYKIDANLC
jgi:hypothetical protein